MSDCARARKLGEQAKAVQALASTFTQGECERAHALTALAADLALEAANLSGCGAYILLRLK